MKNLVRTTAFIFSMLSIVLSCTKEIDLKTEIEFSVTEQHEADGFVDQNLITTITVVPEEILEEFTYSYSYSVSKGAGHFQDRSGEIFPQNENIPLNPLSATVMYVGSEPGENMVKVTATDNYGFTEDVEIEYTLAEIPPVVWTATSPVKRIELGNSAPITVNFEKSEAIADVDYERRYLVTAGSGSLIEVAAEEATDLTEFLSIEPGTYSLNFTPEELGVIELSFDLRGDDGETFKAELSFEVLEEIIDTVIPEITLKGDDTITVQAGSNYKDSGANALDDVDGDITGAIVVDASKVDLTQAGTYKVTYNVSDSAGNAAVEVVRTVNVIAGDDPRSSANEILAFSIPGQNEATDIDKTNHTVTINVPFGTETSVAPSMLGISDNATVLPSVNETQDFGLSVAYTVTAENGVPQIWNVLVNVAESDEKLIETFTIAEVEGAISGTDILVTLAAGNDASALMPTVAFLGSGLSPQSGVIVDFTEPVEYTVTAEDSSTLKYTVRVIIKESEEKDITNFTIEGVSVVPSGTNFSITLPAGNDEKSLTPTIEHTGISISPASRSVIDFTNPVDFTVIAENGTQQDYTASVIIAGDKPTARANSNAMRAGLNKDINFMGSASSDDIRIVSYAWDFGDGNSSTLADAVHRYTMYGRYTVKLTVTDDGGLQDEASVVVDVVNLEPTADDFALQVDQYSSVSFSMFSRGNIQDADGDDLTVSITTRPLKGGVSQRVQDGYLYTPNDGEIGADSIEYTVNDGNGGVITRTINITINPGTRPNRPPTANNFSLTVDQNDNVGFNFRIDGNVNDPDGDPTTISISSNPAKGRVEQVAANGYIYIVDRGASGSDSFGYRVDDGNGGIITRRVDVTIIASTQPNRAPVAFDDTATVARSGTSSISVLSNDRDADGDRLEMTANYTQPANGIVSFASGSFSAFLFRATNGFAGETTFTYEISDGNGGTDTATVRVTVE